MPANIQTFGSNPNAAVTVLGGGLSSAANDLGLTKPDMPSLSSKLPDTTAMSQAAHDLNLSGGIAGTIGRINSQGLLPALIPGFPSFNAPGGLMGAVQQAASAVGTLFGL